MAESASKRKPEDRKKTSASRARKGNVSNSRAGKSKQKTILITGGAGYIGGLFIERLIEENERSKGRFRIAAVDVRLPRHVPAGTEFYTGDVSSPDTEKLFLKIKPDIVVHLAAIVNPPKGVSPETEYRVDVEGTRNVLQACLKAKVSKIIVTSSGAAYGYHADNSEWLKESDPVRGNDTFPYSKHKRLVEEMLADYRKKHPALRQLIFRPGTILGENTDNQITAIFHKTVVPGVAGSDSYFVFIYDRDVVECLLRGCLSDRTGIFNLAGDGRMSLREIARRMGRPFLPIPASVIRFFLSVAKPLRLSRYGPEQVDFLQYRPVLSNDALKSGFGYIPKKTTEEVFELWRTSRKKSRK